MIHYHGGPITPVTAAIQLWKARHACTSFFHPEQVSVAAEVCQSFMLDNGAFSAWKQGVAVDWERYREWVSLWGQHPGCDFAVIPDVIDGDEKANDDLIAWWQSKPNPCEGVPVWHLHESLDRLTRLALSFRRIALGSSGQWATIGDAGWWERMSAAMDAVCDEQGRPKCRLHGLRMLNPTVFSQLPLASADSTNIARNIGIDAKWDRAAYAPKSKATRALILADRIEHHASAATWQQTNGVRENLELFA